MVCDGPDPPDDSPQNLIPPPRHDLIANGNHEDSDEENNEYFGYEPLPQGPESVLSDHDSGDEAENNDALRPPQNVPVIEPMENVISREVWSAPRSDDPIQMDNERAAQVMSLMANFALPQDSIPDWAQSISEDQWKQTLNDRIEKIRSNR